ncbi:MAG TPA: hypothetical protein DCS29_00695 [Candidatus Magasanikbacteria bacterium]|nr:MAG: hypothetical protein A2479_04425 [Candidatus Magasanikbacteria bacterium RIFOXYC2_FULL_39_8]HAT03284.1 hypothetical protein [Candidatus Magasanikbacteria bacterium]
MSKGLKWGLGIGASILVLVLVVLGYKFVNNEVYETAGSYDYEEGYAMDDQFGLAVVSESAGMAARDSAKMVRNAEPSSPSAQNVPSSGTADSDATPTQDRLIVKTGNMSLVVDNVREAIQKINSYTLEKGGFVVSSDISKSGLTLYGNITIRIPVASFDESIEQVKSYGEVTSQAMYGQDVTEEYVDLDAQIKNLRATENQFLEIMKRAVAIEDVLAVQRELSWVRGEIDRIEGRMKYLRQSADLSTLTIYLSTNPEVLPAWDDEDQWKPWAQVKEAFRSLVDVGQGFVNFVIWIVVYIPLWLVIILVVWVIVRIVRRRGNKKLEM